jgi:phage tail sheath protein FI
VIADATVNPRQSVDQGRLIVMIQVAPSQPMEFITVQLVRSGEGELLIV